MIANEFGYTLEQADQVDMGRHLRVMAMRAYDALMTREERGDKLSEADYRLILELEGQGPPIPS